MRIDRAIVVADREEQAAVEIIEAEEMRVMILDAARREHPDIETVRVHFDPLLISARPRDSGDPGVHALDSRFRGNERMQRG